MSDRPLKVYELHVENVKAVKTITVRPDPEVQVFAGQNGAGKTSTLDAIMYALTGKDSHPAEVIRRGQTEGRVRLDLGRFRVERVWKKSADGKPETTAVVLSSEDGAHFGKPQAILDGLTGPDGLAYDPLRFYLMKEAAQLEAYRARIGLDFSEHDSKRLGAFERRTEINREGHALKARFEAMPEPSKDLPATKPDVAELLAQRKRLQAMAEERASKMRFAETLFAKVERKRQARENATAEVMKLRDLLESTEKQRAAAVDAFTSAELEANNARIAAEALEQPDFNTIDNALDKADSIATGVRLRDERIVVETRLTALRAQADQLTQQIEQLDKEKSAKIAAHAPPIPGLQMTDKGLTLNGFALSEASAAEKLRVSIGMGLAGNPKLKTMFARDGSLVDKKTMVLLRDEAKTRGCQLLIEIMRDEPVGRGEIFIVDGTVQS